MHGAMPRREATNFSRLAMTERPGQPLARAWAVRTVEPLLYDRNSEPTRPGASGTACEMTRALLVPMAS